MTLILLIGNFVEISVTLFCLVDEGNVWLIIASSNFLIYH